MYSECNVYWIIEIIHPKYVVCGLIVIVGAQWAAQFIIEHGSSFHAALFENEYQSGACDVLFPSTSHILGSSIGSSEIINSYSQLHKPL